MMIVDFGFLKRREDEAEDGAPGGRPLPDGLVEIAEDAEREG